MIQENNNNGVYVSDAYMAFIVMSKCSENVLRLYSWLPFMLDYNNNVDLIDSGQICKDLKVSLQDITECIEGCKKQNILLETSQGGIYFVNPHMMWNPFRGDTESQAFQRYCLLWDIAVSEHKLDKLNPLNDLLNV